MIEEKVGTLSEKPSCCFVLRSEWCQRGFHPYPSGFCFCELIYVNLQVWQHICGQRAQHWLLIMHDANNLSFQRRPQNKSFLKSFLFLSVKRKNTLLWSKSKTIHTNQTFYTEYITNTSEILQKSYIWFTKENTKPYYYALHVAAGTCSSLSLSQFSRQKDKSAGDD